MAGWHDEAQTLKKITLENITDNVDFLYDLEWQCLATIGGTDDPINVSCLGKVIYSNLRTDYAT